MNTDYSRHYARYHPETPEHDRNLRVLLSRWLAPHLPAHRDASVLDVGCGRGYALEFLRSLGYRQTRGIDRDAGQVNFARNRGLEVEHVADSITYLRARPGTHDLVLLMDVLEHVPRDQQTALLAAIHASLRPGGRLVCTVPNAASPLASYFRYADPTHECAFTRESLEFVLTSAGFAAARIQPAEFFVRPRFLFFVPTRRALQFWLLVLSRCWWRTVCLAELGLDRGWDVPLSLNLLAVADRS